MGFNRRKLEDKRRTVAEREAASRRARLHALGLYCSGGQKGYGIGSRLKDEAAWATEDYALTLTPRR
jgi:hypothetical protein